MFSVEYNVLKLHPEVLDTAKEGSIFVDLGANDGEITQHIVDEIKKRISTYSLYAFDPDARFKSAFQSRLGGNANVHHLNYAVGSQDGVSDFYLSSGQHIDQNGNPGQVFNCSSSLLKPTDTLLNQFSGMKFDETQRVDVITLDSFCEKTGISDIQLIWADIQGAELDMIKGAKQSIQKTKYLFTEYQHVEAYAGCGIGLDAILSALPGWEVVEDFGSDVLLKNIERTQGKYGEK